MKSQYEIEELLNRVMEQHSKGSKFPGMTYEEGVEAALRWVMDAEEVDPLED